MYFINKKVLNILFIFAISGSSSIAGMELPNHTDGKSNSGSLGLNKGSSKRVNAVLHCKKAFFIKERPSLKDSSQTW